MSGFQSISQFCLHLLSPPCSNLPLLPTMSPQHSQPTLLLTTWLQPKVVVVTEEWRGTGLDSAALSHLALSFFGSVPCRSVTYNSFLVIRGLKCWGSSLLHCNPGFWSLSRTTVLWKGLRTSSSNVLYLPMSSTSSPSYTRRLHLHFSIGHIANGNGHLQAQAFCEPSERRLIPT